MINMAYKHLPSMLSPFFILALSLICSTTMVSGARHLMESTPLPKIPELSKPELPPLPTLPTLPKPQLPLLPKPELPPVSHSPTLQKPADLPTIQKPEVPKLPELPHELPKPEFPKLPVDLPKPELPKLPESPHELPKTEVPKLPELPHDLPQPEVPKVPELPKVDVPKLPEFCLMSCLSPQCQLSQAFQNTSPFLPSPLHLKPQVLEHLKGMQISEAYFHTNTFPNLIISYNKSYCSYM
ncbi:hypothetical protein TorRG33x02_058890 [Trema orientale]|uniref:Hydroxyproline-rich glycoprotein family protein n=1 Tax=Trema orientale TaxID=63057 RepID=A0A2P5FKM0_TREOI|nr:hypothetical protein TorRG33x02_058890 [Trema orientale]